MKWCISLLYTLFTTCDMTSQTWSLYRRRSQSNAATENLTVITVRVNGGLRITQTCFQHPNTPTRGARNISRTQPMTTRITPSSPLFPRLGMIGRSRSAGCRRLFLTGRKTGGLTPVRREHPIGLTARPAGR